MIYEVAVYSIRYPKGKPYVKTLLGRVFFTDLSRPRDWDWMRAASRKLRGKEYGDAYWCREYHGHGRWETVSAGNC